MSLEQYYTEEGIGERLASMLPVMNPHECVELSAGEGALLLPIIRKWPNIKITTCELDPLNVSKLKSSFKGKHHNIDVLSDSFEKAFKGKLASFDFAVSNPPFSWRDTSEYDIAILETFGLRDLFPGSRIRSEVLFILQYLRLLAELACVAFILPEFIVCSAAFSKFRYRLLAFCNVVSIAEINSGAFKGTEAKTYILILKKGWSSESFIYTDTSGSSVKKQQKDFCVGLKQLHLDSLPYSDADEFSIKRGTLSGKECKSLGLPFFHTSGFHESATDVVSLQLRSGVITGKKVLTTTKGDILINRVGSRVVGRAVIVEDGQYLVSDCVFRVRLPSSVCSKTFLTFWMKEVFPNITLTARGTCAKYITINDVAAFLREFLKTITPSHTASTR
ncbi:MULTISPECIES: N-6 DNA methylase [Pseudomonas]|uniref:N-6 DNA methylase n=1 Tax=Pseudomonas TaxID=286 RepID=UPI000A0ECD4E|nr:MULTISPECIES: N-6 DNA methylase [Pseudomonas]MDG9918499.1 N-6 DNA methylase [Pseudomonas juntendi]MDH0507512.1 N-6 DNA methylase [Pseudomonas juntendi]MDH1044698.1 N-6 DNA methylase [Pseudomonas juntendi]UJW20895.1 N-6 DNA methylase [Pseudomonas juntendi]SMF60081.1 Type I restriction-modification system methyltransferase subunit [Pseudomonas sp. LAIL14HWK12:I11]